MAQDSAKSERSSCLGADEFGDHAFRQAALQKAVDLRHARCETGASGRFLGEVHADAREALAEQVAKLHNIRSWRVPLFPVAANTAHCNTIHLDRLCGQPRNGTDF